VVIGIPVAVDDLVADSAASHGLHRMRGCEPVQHVHTVAILLHDAAAGKLIKTVIGPILPARRIFRGQVLGTVAPLEAE